MAFDEETVDRPEVDRYMTEEAYEAEAAAADEPDVEEYRESVRMTGEDIDEYRAAVSREGAVPAYIDMPTGRPGEENMRYHESALGTFEYDSREWRVEKMTIPGSEAGSGTETTYLHYIGEETDGAKIRIPAGVEDLSFSFMDGDLESIEGMVIPNSVKYMDGTFMQNRNLKDGSIMLPPSVESGSFMLANCPKMTKGPNVIPGTCKYVDYICANNAAMENTPVFGTGIVSMNGALGGCKTLTEKPRIPRSVEPKQCSDVTYGCTGMDEAAQAERDAKYAKKREKLEKKLNKPRFGEKIGHAISFIMQTNALHKQGTGVVKAMVLAHSYRKMGLMGFGRNFSDGLMTQAMYGDGKGAYGKFMLAQKLQERAGKKELKREASRQAKLAEFDRLYQCGAAMDRTSKRCAASASKDVKRDLFVRVPDMPMSQRKSYLETRGNKSMITEYTNHTVNEFNSLGPMPPKVQANMRKAYAQYYKDRMSEKAAYFTEAESLIKNNAGYTAEQRKKALEGLGVMKDMTLQPLCDSVRYINREAPALFNEGDRRELSEMYASMTGKELFGGERTRERVFGDMRPQRQPMERETGRENAAERPERPAERSDRRPQREPGDRAERRRDETERSDRGSDSDARRPDRETRRQTERDTTRPTERRESRPATPRREEWTAATNGFGDAARRQAGRQAERQTASEAAAPGPEPIERPLPGTSAPEPEPKPVERPLPEMPGTGSEERSEQIAFDLE